MNKIQLTDGKILLRPAEMKDVKEMFGAVQESKVEVGAWMPWCHANYSLGESKNWIKICQKGRKDGTIYDFAITDARDGTILGDCGLTTSESRTKPRISAIGSGPAGRNRALHCRRVTRSRLRF